MTELFFMDITFTEMDTSYVSFVARTLLFWHLYLLCFFCCTYTTFIEIYTSCVSFVVCTLLILTFIPLVFLLLHVHYFSWNLYLLCFCCCMYTTYTNIYTSFVACTLLLLKCIPLVFLYLQQVSRVFHGVQTVTLCCVFVTQHTATQYQRCQPWLLACMQSTHHQGVVTALTSLLLRSPALLHQGVSWTQLFFISKYFNNNNSNNGTLVQCLPYGPKHCTMETKPIWAYIYIQNTSTCA